MTARSMLAAALLFGCTNGPAPSGRDVLLRVEVTPAGVVQSTSADLVAPGSVPRAAAGHPDGELRVDVLDAAGAVAWSGSQYLAFVSLSEEFTPTGIRGTQVLAESNVRLFAFPDDGRDRVRIRVTAVPSDRSEPHVTELDVDVPRPEAAAAASSPLVHVSADVAGRREGLCTAVWDDCNEPEEFCRGAIGACREEACLPDDVWDGSREELRSGDQLHVVIMPNGWGDQGAFETAVRDVIDALYQRNEWYRDHPDAVRWRIWNQECHYQGRDPNANERGELLDWIYGGDGWDGLEDWTVRLPDFDKLVVFGNGGACSGVTRRGQEFVALVPCPDPGHTADVLAHELGHAVAHLNDEYLYGEDDLRDCDSGWSTPLGAIGRDDQFDTPNVSMRGEPKWFCESDTGEVYAGRACGGLSEGVVGAMNGPAGRCRNDVTIPCSNSIMNWHIDNQFDPVGYGAMTYSVENDGDRMGYDGCDERHCDTSCSAYATGTCGLNDCFQLCNSCDTGQRCVGTSPETFQCRDACAGPEASCDSGLGFEFCHDETVVSTDPSCPGMHLRIVTCDNGTPIEGDCIL